MRRIPGWLLLIATVFVAAAAVAGKYIVLAGDTLASIAEDTDFTYVELAYANRLPDSDEIVEGQVLIIPEYRPVVPPNEEAAFISAWSTRAFATARAAYAPTEGSNLPTLADLERRRAKVVRIQVAQEPDNETPILAIDPSPPRVVPDDVVRSRLPGVGFGRLTTDDLNRGLRAGAYTFVRRDIGRSPVLLVSSDRGVHGVIFACAATLEFIIEVTSGVGSYSVPGDGHYAPPAQQTILKTFVRDARTRAGLGPDGTWPPGDS